LQTELICGFTPEAAGNNHVYWYCYYFYHELDHYITALIVITINSSLME